MTRVTTWPAGNPRILVADAWPANSGDGAIALATQRLVRSVLPGASVVHAFYQCDLVADAYPELDIVPPLAALLGISRGSPELASWDGDRQAFVAGADGVLSQGGGFLYEHYDPWARLLAYDTVVGLGLPIAFCGQSIGHFSRARERAVLWRAFRSASAVGVRDPDSALHALDLGTLPQRLLVAADLAFLLFPEPPPPREGSGLAVVLTTHGADPLQPRWDDADLAAIVERIADIAAPETVTLLSTSQGHGHDGRGIEDDAALARRVRERLGPEVAAHVAMPSTSYLSPAAVAAEIGHRRALVTMRLHPAVIGLSVGVPTVLLNPAAKTTAALDSVGLDDLQRASTDDVEAVEAAVRDALAPQATRGAALWSRLSRARDLAGSTGRAVQALAEDIRRARGGVAGHSAFSDRASEPGSG